MAKRVAVIPVMTSATATNTTTVKDTSRLSDISVIVVYDRVSGAGAGTLVFKGTLDESATYTYSLGVRPMITGTVDADASITYSTDTTVGYTIDGVHQFMNLQWTEDTNPASVSIYIVGLEDF